MKEWISVKDGLPPINSWCIVLDNTHKPPIKDIALFSYHREGYFFCIGRDIKQTWLPTHWMLLPEFPEEKG